MLGETGKGGRGPVGGRGGGREGLSGGCRGLNWIIVVSSQQLHAKSQNPVFRYAVNG